MYDQGAAACSRYSSVGPVVSENAVGSAAVGHETLVPNRDRDGQRRTDPAPADAGGTVRIVERSIAARQHLAEERRVVVEVLPPAVGPPPREDIVPVCGARSADDVEDRRRRRDGLVRVPLVVQEYPHSDAPRPARACGALDAERAYLAAAARSVAAVWGTPGCGPMCRAASGDASSALRAGSTQWPSSRLAAPKACHSGGRSGESSTRSSVPETSILPRPSGGMPMIAP